MKDQWFHPIDWPGWGELERLGKVQPVVVQVSDHAPPQTVLLGPKGEPLLVRQPRPMGFRPLSK